MKIRISCSSLASIKIDNLYLLCLNKSQLKSGKMVYTPFGGALEYSPNALVFLNNIESEFERSTPDLRLNIDDSNLPLFDFWFDSKKDRESSINRELIEEMVLEENVFDNLTTSDFESKYILCDKNKSYYNGILNHRYFEIYEVIFNIDKIEEIRENLKRNDTNLRLVTKDEILKGVTDDGLQIGNNSKSILV